MKNNDFTKYIIGLSALFIAASSHAAFKIEQWQTKRGANVYFVENHDLPIIDISTNFRAGSAYDDKVKSGTASLTRSLMYAGAAGLTEEQISTRMADIGANLGGDLDADRAGFKLRTLSSARERDLALEVYINILQKPDFPADILAREKSRLIAALEEKATQPESIANKAFMQALYGEHPYAMEESGEPETVANIQLADLQAFYKKHYGAQGAVVALMGDMTRTQAEEIAEKITVGLPDSPPAASIPAVSYPSAASEKAIQHPASQSHILYGYPGIKRGDPDYFPLYVGNYILGGGGFVSRLTEEVREKRGLVYSVYSYFAPMAALGPFQIGLQTKKEQAKEAMQVVDETLAKFMKEGVTEKELKAAKDNIIGGFPLRLDSNAKILDYLAVIGFYKLSLNYLETFNKRVNEVTTAQIKDAFIRRVDTSKMVKVVVGE